MTDEHHADRRSFLKTGAIAGTALAAGTSGAFAQLADSSRPTKGDVAILKFLSAIEQIESDLWLQYAELGGVQDSEIPGLSTSTKGNTPYTNALNNLDGDMSQYIHDNTEDEFSHHLFLNEFLESISAKPVDLSKFATLPSSKATGANQIGRLTNLMQLIVDTSWWTRYRSRDKNPDLDPSFVFPQAVPSLFIKGKPHPAIPPVDITDKDHIQAIANTAAFHFAFIEQGGSKPLPDTGPEGHRSSGVADPARASARRRPCTSRPGRQGGQRGFAYLGPSDIWRSHVSEPQCTSFPSPTPIWLEDFQTNLIMPEPCPFLSRKFPVVSIIRPISISTAIFGASGDYKRLHG